MNDGGKGLHKEKSFDEKEAEKSFDEKT